MLIAHEMAICKNATAVSLRFYIDRQIFKIPLESLESLTTLESLELGLLGLSWSLASSLCSLSCSLESPSSTSSTQSWILRTLRSPHSGLTEPIGF